MRLFVCPAFVGKSAFSGNAFPDALYYGPHCTPGTQKSDAGVGIGTLVGERIHLPENTEFCSFLHKIESCVLIETKFISKLLEKFRRQT